MTFKLKAPVPEDQLIATNRQLVKMIIPLIAEQFLVIFVGLVDTAMVSYLSEAAVSGVSLVDMINQLIIQVLAALATGGAVIASQYIGHKEKDKACESADQLLVLIVLIALGIMALILIFRKPLLRLIFGKIEDDVMTQALIYMKISAISYPFLALYSAGTAIFRSVKKTNITLLMSLMMNVVNIIFNFIFMFGMSLGVAGAALGSLAGRGSAGIAVVLLLVDQKKEIHLAKPKWPLLEAKMVKRILYIGIPNGLENGMFQLGKIIVVSVISVFGTVQIAANAVAGNVDAFGVIPGFSFGLAMITIVGQCVGAGDYAQAEYFTKKLTRLAWITMIIYNAVLLVLLPQILNLYVLSDETRQLASTLITMHFIAAMVLWVPSFALPNALRAGNDVKFTMAVSITSMWVFRVFSSVILGRWLGLGVIGVWIAMFLDWIFRAVMFMRRFKSKKWQRVKLI